MGQSAHRQDCSAGVIFGAARCLGKGLRNGCALARSLEGAERLCGCRASIICKSGSDCRSPVQPRWPVPAGFTVMQHAEGPNPAHNATSAGPAFACS